MGAPRGAKRYIKNQSKKQANSENLQPDPTLLPRIPCPFHCGKEIEDVNIHKPFCEALQTQNHEKAKQEMEKRILEDMHLGSNDDDEDIPPYYDSDSEVVDIVDSDGESTKFFSVNSKQSTSESPMNRNAQFLRAWSHRNNPTSRQHLYEESQERVYNDKVIHGDLAAHVLVNEDNGSVHFFQSVTIDNPNIADTIPDTKDERWVRPGLIIDPDIGRHTGIDNEEITLPGMEDDDDSLSSVEPVRVCTDYTPQQQEHETTGEKPPPQSTNPDVNRLLLMHPNLGCKLHRPLQKSGGQDIYDKTTLSMLRIIDYCDSMAHSREFVDGLVKILAEEMKIRKFHPANAKTRKYYSDLAIKKYGGELSPEVGRFRVVGDSDPLQSVMESHEESTNRAPPRKKGTESTETPTVMHEDVQGQFLPTIETRERDLLNCVAFNFETQVLDLLNDKLFGNRNNLVVNKENPFHPYQHINGSDDMNDGSWYTDTIDRLSRGDKPFDPRYEYLVPIILYADKTGITQNQRYPLEPVIFSTSIIRRELRNYPQAWRPLGFMPDLESKSSSENTVIRNRNKSTMPKSYHRFLSFIVRSLLEVEKKGMVTWVREGDQVSQRRVRFELQCIIGDGKSADMMTTRHGGHTPGCNRISRSCFTPQTDCDNVLEKCSFVDVRTPYTRCLVLAGRTTMQPLDANYHFDNYEPSDFAYSQRELYLPDLQRIPCMTAQTIVERYKFLLLYNTKSEVNRRKNKAATSSTTARDGSELERRTSETKEQKELLQVAKQVQNACKQYLVTELGFHPVPNAFHYFNFGGDPSHVWGACPTDLMHAFQSGLLMYITRMLLDRLPPMKRTSLDRMVDRCLGQLRTSTKKSWPRFNFAKGFCKLSFITSDEWVGKLFVLLIMASLEEGRVIMQTRFHDKDQLDLDNIEDFRKLQHVQNQTTMWQDAIYYSEQTDKLDNQKQTKRNESTGRDAEEEDDECDYRREEEYLARKSCGFVDFVHLAEAMLCFHAWYKRCVISNYSMDDIEGGVRRLLAMVKCYLPRGRGMAWCIQKFHELLHLAREARRFGSPKNYDAGPLESSLKFWAKFFAVTAQKRGYNSFVHQVAIRIHEQQSLFKMRRRNLIEGVNDGRLPDLNDNGEIIGDQTAKVGGGPVLCGSRYRVYRTLVPVKTNPIDEERDQMEKDRMTQDQERAKPRKKRKTVATLTGKQHQYIATEQAGDDTSKGRARKGYSRLHPLVEDKLREVTTPSLAAEDSQSPRYTADTDTEEPGPEKGYHGESSVAEYWDVYTECEFVYVNQRRDPAAGRNDEGPRRKLRAHPNYHNEGEFYDWVIVEFTIPRDAIDRIEEMRQTCGVDPQHGPNFVPCKLFGFTKDSKTGTVMAIVHACNWQSEEEIRKGSVLLEHWSLDFEQMDKVFYKSQKDREMGLNPMRHMYRPKLYFVTLDSIKCPCLVVEATPGPKHRIWIGEEESDPKNSQDGRRKLKYDTVSKLRRAQACILVRTRNEWGQKFIGW